MTKPTLRRQKTRQMLSSLDEWKRRRSAIKAAIDEVAMKEAAKGAEAARQRELDQVVADSRAAEVARAAAIVAVGERMPPPKVKGRGGRPASWDWPELVRRIEEINDLNVLNGILASLVKYCQEYVRKLPQSFLRSDCPDNSTTKDAIKKYQIRETVLKKIGRGN
jgi:hypothetical protein